jgi:hypothetical protein
MDLPNIAGILAGFVAASGFIPYIYSILKGKTRPNRASWLIWAALGGLLFASYVSSGASTTIWQPLSFAIGPVIVFVLSIKHGVGGYNKLDVFCLAGAALGLLLWKLSNEPQAALYLSIFVDALGFLPTIKKAYFQPGSESRLAWSIGVTSTVINLFAINSWTLEIALYPIYLVIFNSAVLILLFGSVQKRTRIT